MKVLFVSYGCPSVMYPVNGVFQFDQAKALRSAGIDVAFAAIDLRSIRKWRKWGLHSFSRDDIPIFEMNIPLGPFPDCLLEKFGRSGFSAIYRHVEKAWGRPDIIHAHFGETAAYTTGVIRKEHLPLLLTEHSSRLNSPSPQRELHKRLRPVYDMAEKIIAVSNALACNIEKWYGRKPAVVPNMVDLKLFLHGDRSLSDHMTFRFVTCSNLVTTKGHDFLLRAFSAILLEHSNCSLTIWGDGVERKRLEGLAEFLGCAGNVTFKGRADRRTIAADYHTADAFILASKTETFGIVFIEAMAAGLPVIATACGGPEDFVNDRNGILVPVNDSEALENAMLEMISNIRKYDRNKIAMETANRFSPQTIAGQLIATYYDVLYGQMEVRSSDAK